MSAALRQPEADRAGDGARGARPPLLAFAADAASEAVLRDALAIDIAEGAEVRRGTLAEAARILQRTASPRVLLVDISGSDQPLSELGELAQLVEPDVRVLAIGDRQDLALYRGLTHGLGVLDYLFKPLTREMVTQHFAPLIARQMPGPRLLRGGRIIAVTGVHGGVGASSIAANLAWYLAERARRPTVLLDGDLYGGAAAMLLSAKPSPGLRVALEKPDRVDELFIDRTAQTVGERLHVLSGEGGLAEAPSIAPEALSRLLEVLRRRFNFVVCDAPWPGSAIGRELVEAAHQRVLVTVPTVAGARDALRYLALPQPQVAGGPPLVVLNQSGLPGALDVARFTKAVGREPDLVIPHLHGALRGAANLGEPAVIGNARFRTAIERLAFRAGSIGVERAPRRGILGRLGSKQ